MKVTFYSNFMNHHQLPFSLAMDKLTNGSYTFVATTPTSQERLQMGYHDMNKQYPFVLTTYDSPENAQKALALALESDVIITGSAPEMYTRLRIERNRLTFRYSERIFKEGLLHLKTPHRLGSMMKHHTRYRSKQLYMLCASAYTPRDFGLVGAYKGKTFKWGYFPEVKRQDTDRLMQKKTTCQLTGLKYPPVSILWAGRLIGWKHPEAAIYVAEQLKQNGYRFDMQIIGNGEMQEQLQRMIRDKQLDDCVNMLGAMSPEAVREHMEAADIFLFTSDFNEGWGAVLNESMNSGCAVVASHAIGSVPFLIQDGANGLVYKNGNQHQLEERVEKLIRDSNYRKQLGMNAYESIINVWSAEVAAKRFVELSETLLKGESANTLFAEGPCSKAKILKNDWYSSRV